jgi:hypothetical protein
MLRLKDLDKPTSPIEADAVALLRSAVGYEPPAGQKQRVRARLLQQRVTRHAAVFRPAVVAGVILFTAVASAAVGRRWIAQTIHVLVRAPSPERIITSSESAVVPPRRKGKRVALATATTSPSAAPSGVSAISPLSVSVSKVSKVSQVSQVSKIATVSETQAVPTAGFTTAAVPLGDRSSGRRGERNVAPARVGGTKYTLVAVKAPAGRDLERGYARDWNLTTSAADPDRGGVVANRMVASRSSGDRQPADRSPVNRQLSDQQLDGRLAIPPSPGEDTGLVFDAMRALRQEAHPELASMLLDEYLRRFPQGSLAEEALALSIEAAARRGDARTRKLVGQYLSRYPLGHFRAAVENARARLAL